MFNDHPESGEAHIVTSPGEKVSFQELSFASELSTRRYYATRQICPKAGECVLSLRYKVMEGTEGRKRVDIYYIDCDDEDCALLIGQDDQSR